MEELGWSLLLMFEGKMMNEDSISMHFIFIQVVDNLYAIYLSVIGFIHNYPPFFHHFMHKSFSFKSYLGHVKLMYLFTFEMSIVDASKHGLLQVSWADFYA